MLGAFIIHAHGHAVGAVAGGGGTILISDDSYDNKVEVTYSDLQQLFAEFASAGLKVFKLFSGAYRPEAYPADFHLKAGGGQDVCLFKRPAGTKRLDVIQKDEVYTELSKCAVCGGGLQLKGEVCEAKVWDGRRWDVLRHGRKRCKQCGATHRLYFAWRGGRKSAPSLLSVSLVSLAIRFCSLRTTLVSGLVSFASWPSDSFDVLNRCWEKPR